MATVSLRRVKPADADLIHGWRTETSIAQYQPLLPMPLADVREMLVQRSFTSIGPQAIGDIQWLIIASGTPVGWVSLKISPPDRAHGKGMIGYAIGEAHRHRGYGTAGVNALLPIAFDRKHMNLERLEAVAAASNTGSRRVLEANGFQFEGIQRGLLVIGGERVDHAMYGLLRSDLVPWSREG